MKKENSAITVAVGMSGGVDSSLTALLLKEQGYRVFGIFMKNWEEKESTGYCQAAKDFEDVIRVCQEIDIPYYSVNFSDAYWDEVFEDFLHEIRAGRTPNPDVLCNKEIKFHHLLNKAKALGADLLATGHYCRTENGKLYKGLDPNKDQSYFLHAVDHSALQQVLFPLGHLHKTEVRELAKKHHLATSEKKDSTGICFIGKRPFKEFLQQYLPTRPGHFEDLEGNILGDHQGAIFYTIGQRKGLGIGGPGEAYFVADKDISRNAVILVQGGEHPALFSYGLIADKPTWISGHAPDFPLRCKAKIRYRQEAQACTVTMTSDNRLSVQFDEPQRAITPSQSIVFYNDDLCLGGAFIDHAFPSLHHQNPEEAEKTHFINKLKYSYF